MTRSFIGGSSAAVLTSSRRSSSRCRRHTARLGEPRNFDSRTSSVRSGEARHRTFFAALTSQARTSRVIQATSILVRPLLFGRAMTPPPPALRKQLLHEHRALEQLFDRLMNAFQANAREDIQAIWTELDRNLEQHFELEERVFFPRFAKVDLLETASLLEEHEGMRKLCAELGVGVDLKLVRTSVANGFIALLKAHAKREELVLYRWVNETLQDDPEVREWISQPIAAPR